MQNAIAPANIEVLTDALPEDAVQEWLADEPADTGDLISDRVRYRTFWQGAEHLIDMMPEKSARPAAQEQAVQAIQGRTRESRDRFLRTHARAVYGAVTRRMERFVRVEELLFAAGDAFPGLVPKRAQIAAEKDTLQRDKDGLEIDQGVLISHILAADQTGRHLCHAMLLPRPESEDALAKLRTDGVLDLGSVRLERHGRAIHLIMSNPRFLNAEDQTTIDAMEIGVDVAILDPESDIAVLRGAPVEHPKYAGRRVFGSGINLTHLYRGKIPFVWYLQRELGFVHKFLRGVAKPDVLPDDVTGCGIEKPWVAAVESFAIGGHCQILLTMDFVLAAQDAYLTLPARKEGIVPGAANLRLPRFTGDRIARQAIQYERKTCVRQFRRQPDLRRDHARRPDGPGDRARRHRAHQLGRSGSVEQSACVPRRRGAARYVPPLLRGLRARAGPVSFQPGADRQPGALLERPEPRGVGCT